ncbi:MAG: TIGR03790 family protein [Methylacidiphilales bacterium]|nr:TIGR03790 family protein [Candidatus Methylacidiphilales bacterium]
MEPDHQLRRGAPARCAAWPWAGRLAVLVLLVGTFPAVRAQEPLGREAPGSNPPPRFWTVPPALPGSNSSPSQPETHPDLPPPPETNGLSIAPKTESVPESEGIATDTDKAREAARMLAMKGDPEALPKHLLVVYNSNDSDSRSLAQYYAQRRNIPPERVLAIACPTTEEITREQYEGTIREPIISYLMQKNWMDRRQVSTHLNSRPLDLLVATRNDIWAIVLMRGVPLKIAPDPNNDNSMQAQAVLQTNAAAVDSELALLPIFGLPKGGFVPNIFFDPTMKGIYRPGPELARNIILVTRLDGPRPADVRRVIDDTLYAEKNRLAGLTVIDTRGLTDVKNQYTSGDTWLRGARAMLAKAGWLIKFDDNPDVLPPTDPCNHVAIYLGWYTGNATGPWVTSPDRFVKGAIAYHLHSYSASTVRSLTDAWVGPLIAHGAAATMGDVYEPYLVMTPHEDIFTKHLLDGDYFAEAAYAAQPGLSWMTTVVGDPLYRPFLVPLDEAVARAGTPRSNHDDWLLLQQVQRKIAAGKLTADTDTLVHALDVPGAGPIAEEGLGDLLAKSNDPNAGQAAEAAYKQAMIADAAPIDRIRVGLKLAQIDAARGDDEDAQIELKTLWRLYPNDARKFGMTNPSSSAPVNSPAEPPKP